MCGEGRLSARVIKMKLGLYAVDPSYVGIPKALYGLASSAMAQQVRLRSPIGNNETLTTHSESSGYHNNSSLVDSVSE